MTVQRKSYNTGMAGEFYVMESLFRLGHMPNLTLGYAKSIDIFTISPNGKNYKVSVKAIRRSGKWGVGKEDYSNSQDLVFVMLLYKKFDCLNISPETWIIPATDVQKLKKQWEGGTFAVYCSNTLDREKLEPYKDKWQKYLD